MKTIKGRVPIVEPYGHLWIVVDNETNERLDGDGRWSQVSWLALPTEAAAREFIDTVAGREADHISDAGKMVADPLTVTLTPEAVAKAERVVGGHEGRAGDVEGCATGVELIAAERQRQMEVEGWTPEHDDEHTKGELAVAAAHIIDVNVCAIDQNSISVASVQWNDEKWIQELVLKHPPGIRGLAIAGALIAAEIDRLQRKLDAIQGTLQTDPENFM